MLKLARVFLDGCEDFAAPWAVGIAWGVCMIVVVADRADLVDEITQTRIRLLMNLARQSNPNFGTIVPAE